MLRPQKNLRVKQLSFPLQTKKHIFTRLMQKFSLVWKPVLPKVCVLQCLPFVILKASMLKMKKF